MFLKRNKTIIKKKTGNVNYYETKKIYHKNEKPLQLKHFKVEKIRQLQMYFVKLRILNYTWKRMAKIYGK